MKFGDNIKYLRELKGLNQKELALELALTNTSISNWENGVASPDVFTSIKLSNYFGISVNDLFTKNLSVNEKDNSHYINTIETNKESVISENGIPYYELLPASAGDFTSFLNQAKPTSHINLPQLSDCTAILPVYGSSMKGVIEPGDLIAIKEIKNRYEFDPVLPYLVITEEHRMIKYLRVDDVDSSIIWAESTNHSKIKLTSDSIKMVYAIKCVIRFF